MFKWFKNLFKKKPTTGSGTFITPDGFASLNVNMVGGGAGSGPIAIDGKSLTEYYPADSDFPSLNNMKPGIVTKDFLDNVSYQSDPLPPFKKTKKTTKKKSKKKGKKK